MAHVSKIGTSRPNWRVLLAEDDLPLRRDAAPASCVAPKCAVPAPISGLQSIVVIRKLTGVRIARELTPHNVIDHRHHAVVTQTPEVIGCDQYVRKGLCPISHLRHSRGGPHPSANISVSMRTAPASASVGSWSRAPLFARCRRAACSSGFGSGRDIGLLQRRSTDGGYTDVELNAANRFHAILEAKRFWTLPGETQLRRYHTKIVAAHSRASERCRCHSYCGTDCRRR